MSPPSGPRTSTHDVLPPYRTVEGPGLGSEPRVPQKRIHMSPSASLRRDVDAHGSARGHRRPPRDYDKMTTPSLEREQLVTECLILAQARGRPAEPYRALFQHVDAVGESQREVDVLLGQQDRQASALEQRDLLLKMVDDQWRQPLGRLVEQQQLGVAHERACDGQHLLLAAREKATLARG